MSPPTERPLDALALLGDVLGRCGYSDFVTCFNPLAARPAAWRAAREDAPERLRPVIDLFLLQARVDRATLPPAVRRLVGDLGEAGVLVSDGSGILHTDNVVVLLVYGSWLLCQPGQADPVHYLGPDSLALLARLAPAGASSCLDLCSGPGLHALHAARFSSEVTAVERDPRAAAVARLNTRLNRCSDQVEVLTGDLFEPVAGRRFDVITANPPSLPYPADLVAPTIGHGGDDGLGVTWQILDGLPGALRDGGQAHLAGMALGHGAAPLPIERLGSVARARDLDLCCSIISSVPLAHGGVVFERLLRSVSCITGHQEAEARDAYERLLARTGADRLSTYFLHARPGHGAIDVIDLSRHDSPEQWFL